jgi:hypothetical protein
MDSSYLDVSSLGGAAGGEGVAAEGHPMLLTLLVLLCCLSLQICCPSVEICRLDLLVPLLLLAANLVLPLRPENISLVVCSS